MVPVHLVKLIQNACKALHGIDLESSAIQIQPTRPEFEGSHTVVVFGLTRFIKSGPEQLGTAIGDYLLKNNKEIEKYNVVKGFLNISFTDTFWNNLFKETIYTHQNYGFAAANGKKVMVEYSSPNTNKPLHLGHLRNNFLGYSVAEILKANGYEVIKANLINDRGIHICKSMIAYQKFGNNEQPSATLKGDHLVGKYYVVFDKEYKTQISNLKTQGLTEEEAEKKAPLMLEAQEMLRKWEEGDKETVNLWKKMNGWVYEGFASTYKRMGVDFDKMYYESNTYLLGKDIVEEGLQKGVFFKKPDNSVWIDLTDMKLDEKLVLRGDGTSVYITQDIGTADLKYKEFGADKSIYVVGNEQDYHFNVLIGILKKLQKPYADGVYHLSYGMVDLPSGKMKSREGTVVDADDIMQEMADTAKHITNELGKTEGLSEQECLDLYETVGMGALKYFLLKVDPKKRMLFNPEESIDFKGNTAPFIQYTYARMNAILRKAESMGVDSANIAINAALIPEVSEKNIVILLEKYPQTVAEAGNTYSPYIIAQFAYDLAKEYNRFYTEVSIFNEENKDKFHYRVALTYSVAKTIKAAMKLLGINVPNRM